MVSDKKICSMLMSSLYKPIDTCDPKRPAHFWPPGYNLNKLGRGPLDDATYQIPIYKDSRPCGFRQEDLFMFPYIRHNMTTLSSIINNINIIIIIISKFFLLFTTI